MNLKQSMSLIHLMAVMKLKSQSNKLVLSYLWWVLEPAFMIAMFYFVFQVLLQRGGDGFFSFLMVGKIAFMWFQKSVVSAASSLTQNKGLILSRDMPRVIFPLVNIMEACYKQVFVFFVLILLLFFLGFSPLDVNWLDLLWVVAFQLLLMIAVGMCAAVVVTHTPDFSFIINMLMMGLMFCSGIFWDVHALPDTPTKALLVNFNPLVSLIDSYRAVFLRHEPVALDGFLPGIMLCIPLIVIAWLILHRYSGALVRRLMA